MKTLHDLYNSPGFQRFQENKLGNDLFINDPDRANRIHEAAEHGCDGSTHAETIEDWREYLEQAFEEEESAAWNHEDEKEGERSQAEIDTTKEAIEAEIAKCEAWHEKNGSLHEQP